MYNVQNTNYQNIFYHNHQQFYHVQLNIYVQLIFTFNLLYQIKNVLQQIQISS